MSINQSNPADATSTIGTIIDDRARRDAIHIAVEPVVAAHDLEPGSDIGFIEGAYGYSDNPVGIADPFLQKTIRKGERFWLFVYPRTITSLRHMWSHPCFPDNDAQKHEDNSNFHEGEDSSISWMKDYANIINETYESVMFHAKNYIDHDVYWSDGDKFEGEHIHDEFWAHYAIITGTPYEDRGSFFACSC